MEPSIEPSSGMYNESRTPEQKFAYRVKVSFGLIAFALIAALTAGLLYAMALSRMEKVATCPSGYTIGFSDTMPALTNGKGHVGECSILKPEDRSKATDWESSVFLLVIIGGIVSVIASW